MKTIKKPGKLIPLFAIVFALCACEEDGVIGTGSSPNKTTAVAQKGPFKKDSAVTIEKLDNNSAAVLHTSTINTRDNLGNFPFDPEPNALYKLSIQGYFLSEISGRVSSAPITLNAIHLSNTRLPEFLGINVLTHISTPRILQLINLKTPARTAIRLTQLEINAAVNSILPIEVFLNSDFTQLSLYTIANTREQENAYLLLFSAIINQAALKTATGTGIPPETALMQLLDRLAVEIRDSGHFHPDTQKTLIAAALKLNPDNIRRNLEALSEQTTNQTLPVPDINVYMDTDGDGTLNSIDQDDDGDNIPDADDSAPYNFNHDLVIGACSTCHNGIDASGKTPDHPPSNEECDLCHSSGQWLPAMTDTNTSHDSVTEVCSTCHNGVTATGKALNHISTIEECGHCHTTSQWLPSAVDHSMLSDTCASCHNAVIASGQSPSHIPSTLLCEACHNTFPYTWAPVPAFAVDHTQVIGTCVSCHNNVLAAGKPLSHISSSDVCDSCHSSAPTPWAPVFSVDHSQVLGLCSSCHTLPSGHQATNDECDTCHSVFSWLNATAEPAPGT